MKPEKLQWDHWSEDLAVGVAGIDDDHKEILALIARLSRANAEAGAEPSAVDEAIRVIAAYSERHFAREERMLEAVGYAFLEQHRLRHQSFRAFVDAARGNDQLSPAELFSYLVDWWIGHIATDDKFYRSSLEGKDAAVAEALALF